MGDNIYPQAYLDFRMRWKRNSNGYPTICDAGYSNGNIGETVRCDRKWKILDGGL